ncbi:hypothetical protein PDE_04617 [Penicillium oxalicum 114-2]|uniref:GED domain-containing protein n=1 Tax=Penicillium oxalicum (strain 114-2 / CGMCC 5302) TaxID=933388 RepID=S8B520_PENO1|nr:hypothetical protein PDE_04617 [Penicillium oxalicum 114-2]
MMGELIKKYHRAICAANFLHDIERAGTPMTLNHYLNENLQNCWNGRLQKKWEEKAIDAQTSGLGSSTNGASEKMIRLKDLQRQNNIGTSGHTLQNIHDILKCYYKVACRRFVDNVCMQASDHYLVTGLEPPLRLFDPAWVIGLSNSQLEEIAGESTTTKRQRLRLRKEVQDLESGRRALVE